MNDDDTFFSPSPVAPTPKTDESSANTEEATQKLPPTHVQAGNSFSYMFLTIFFENYFCQTKKIYAFSVDSLASEVPDMDFPSEAPSQPDQDKVEEKTDDTNLEDDDELGTKVATPGTEIVPNQNTETQEMPVEPLPALPDATVQVTPAVPENPTVPQMPVAPKIPKAAKAVPKAVQRPRVVKDVPDDEYANLSKFFLES